MGGVRALQTHTHSVSDGHLREKLFSPEFFSLRFLTELLVHLMESVFFGELSLYCKVTMKRELCGEFYLVWKFQKNVRLDLKGKK